MEEHWAALEPKPANYRPFWLSETTALAPQMRIHTSNYAFGANLVVFCMCRRFISYFPYSL